jgi:hypothetical protein
MVDSKEGKEHGAGSGGKMTKHECRRNDESVFGVWSFPWSLEVGIWSLAILLYPRRRGSSAPHSRAVVL